MATATAPPLSNVEEILGEDAQDLLQHRVVVELGRQRTADLQPATKPALINLDARGGLTLDRVHHAGD